MFRLNDDCGDWSGCHIDDYPVGSDSRRGCMSISNGLNADWLRQNALATPITTVDCCRLLDDTMMDIIFNSHEFKPVQRAAVLKTHFGSAIKAMPKKNPLFINKNDLDNPINFKRMDRLQMLNLYRGLHGGNLNRIGNNRKEQLIAIITPILFPVQPIDITTICHSHVITTPEAVAPIAKVAAVPTVAPLPTAPTVARPSGVLMNIPVVSPSRARRRRLRRPEYVRRNGNRTHSHSFSQITGAFPTNEVEVNQIDSIPEAELKAICVKIRFDTARFMQVLELVAICGRRKLETCKAVLPKLSLTHAILSNSGNFLVAIPIWTDGRIASFATNSDIKVNEVPIVACNRFNNIPFIFDLSGICFLSPTAKICVSSARVNSNLAVMVVKKRTDLMSLIRSNSIARMLSGTRRFTCEASDGQSLFVLERTSALNEPLQCCLFDFKATAEHEKQFEESIKNFRLNDAENPRDTSINENSAVTETQGDSQTEGETQSDTREEPDNNQLNVVSGPELQAEEAYDDEALVSDQILSLRCPMSIKRLKIPIKSVCCQHQMPIDYESLLSLLEYSPTPNCPVCNVVLNAEDVYIDPFFSYLLQCSPDSDKVKLHSDGRVTSVLDTQPTNNRAQISTIPEVIDLLNEGTSGTTHGDTSSATEEPEVIDCTSIAQMQMQLQRFRQQKRIKLTGGESIENAIVL